MLPYPEIDPVAIALGPVKVHWYGLAYLAGLAFAWWLAVRRSRLPGAAPICVAKGVDEIAAQIREVAMEAGVPIHRDPPTARAIHATVRIGEEIRPEHYQAIAAAIRFAEKMRARMRAQYGRPRN